jgi:hypothetical protein
MRKREFVKMEKMHPYTNGQKYTYRIFGGDGSRRDVRIYDWGTLNPVETIHVGPAIDGNIYIEIWNAVAAYLKNITAEFGFSSFELSEDGIKWTKFVIE